MLISTLLFVFPSKLPKMPQCCHHRGDSKSGKRLERVEPLLPWKVAVDKVPWGLIFLLGGGFAMAHASEVVYAVKFSRYFINYIFSALAFLRFYILDLSIFSKKNGQGYLNYVKAISIKAKISQKLVHVMYTLLNPTFI